MARLIKRKRLIYLRRRDGLIQRYAVNDPDNFPNRVTKREFNRQRRELKKVRALRRAAKRRLEKIATDAAPEDGEALPHEDITPIKFGRGKVPNHLLTYNTFFQAAGTSSPGEGTTFDDWFQYDDDLMRHAPKGFDNGPGIFRSTSSLGGLGQAKWRGIVPLESLIGKLNDSLDIRDFRGRLMDFRAVYEKWSMRYFIREELTTGGGRRIVADFTADDRNPRGTRLV